MRGLVTGAPAGLGGLGGLSPGEQPQQESVDQLELLFYETQLELYDTKFETLKYEEQLLVAQVDTLRRQIRGEETTRPPVFLQRCYVCP